MVSLIGYSKFCVWRLRSWIILTTVRCCSASKPYSIAISASANRLTINDQSTDSNYFQMGLYIQKAYEIPVVILLNENSPQSLWTLNGIHLTSTLDTQWCPADNSCSNSTNTGRVGATWPRVTSSQLNTSIMSNKVKRNDGQLYRWCKAYSSKTELEPLQ